MTNREYTALVEVGKFPESPRVPLDMPFVNANGKILNLLTEKFTHAAVLHSPAGVVRANHYHKTDWHYAYVVSGSVDYYWRPFGSKAAPKNELFHPGQMFFSPPLVVHAMVFYEPTIILTFAKNARSEHRTHEDDLVRVTFIESRWIPEEGVFSPFFDGVRV